MSSSPTQSLMLASSRLDGIVALYFAAHAAYIVLTRLATDTGAWGLAILPYSLLAYALLTILFIWLSGWHRYAHRRRFGRLVLPAPTRETALSGVGSAMMLSSIPLAYSFNEVSVALALLLLRGGALAIAPLVDLMHRRHIHWRSGVALVMVTAALLLALQARGDSRLPLPVILTLSLYNLGFLIRLAMMTRIAKRGDDAQSRGYFVEEKMVALPLSCAVLVGIVVASTSAPVPALHVDWSAGLLAITVGMGLALAASSILTSLILLNARENSYCVPLERATSLLGGMAAAWLLHWAWRLPSPTDGEMLGAALLLGAIVLLALQRRIAIRRNPH